MIILGLTGSIGMGKSTCGQIFKDLGYGVHCSDQAVHQLLADDHDTQQDLLKAFPDLSLPIDRKALGQIIFHNPGKKAVLEGILHPKVRQSQANFIDQQRQKNAKLCVLDIPLLYETNAQQRCDYVAVASAPFSVQKQRVLQRPSMTEDKFNAILAQQMPDADKRKRADFIIPTGDGIANSKDAICALLTKLGV